MRPIDSFLDDIDSCRARRARELSDIKLRFGREGDPLFRIIESKALIVLSYSHWEGFFNECVCVYYNYLSSTGQRVRDIAWTLLGGLLISDLQRLRDRNHSHESVLDFVEGLQSRLDEGFSRFDVKYISSRSNLNHARLCAIFRSLSFDVRPYDRYRIRLDKELVGWRHSIAHGNPLALDSVDANSHIELTHGLMSITADLFQCTMVEYACRSNSID